MAIGRWRDPASAVGLTLVAVASALTSPPGRTGLDALGIILLVVAGLSTAVRRRAPLAALAVTVAAGLGYEALGYPGLAPIVPFLVALATAAWSGHRRPAIAGAAVMVIGGLVVQQTIGGAAGDTSRDVNQRWFLAIGWMVAAIVGGTLAARYQTYLAAVEQRAEEAERTREEVARRRADEERLRIARELHDSLTHSISIIKVQAGVAIHLARKRAEPVPEALLVIEQAGGDAMRELRATLEVLRADDDTGSGLDRLNILLDGARRAGLPVSLDVTGDPRDVPAPVGRAAYRIIQESLTNVRRHAGPDATASVRLGYHEGELSVSVDDDGPAHPTSGGSEKVSANRTSPASSVKASGTDASDQANATGAGRTGNDASGTGVHVACDRTRVGLTSGRANGAEVGQASSETSGLSAALTGGETSGAGVGLRGMRERVAALGGSLEVGPADGGGFRVHARIPLGTS
jgi:signal transduction histidine kinase